MKKIELRPNVYLTTIDTAQFKDVLLSVRFMAPTERRSALIRNILAEMLEDRCEAWPSKLAISSHLDDLYGASVAARCASFGKAHMLEIRLKCLCDQYTRENTVERLFKTAHEFIFNPLKKDGLLDAALFEEAKRETLMANQRRLEQPSSRAVAEACALFGQSQALAETQLYCDEEINSITLEEVSAAYEHLFTGEQIMIFVIGRIDEEKIQSYAQRFFPFEANAAVLDHVYKIQTDQLKEKSKRQRIDQTALVMMFSSGITIADEDYWNLRVANGLFGQLPTSLLFSEVREKHSLCYSISSSTLPYEGALMVTTGIQKKDLQKTADCIMEQLSRMRQGDFDEEALETSKRMLKNAVLSSLDDPLSTLNSAFLNVLLKRDEETAEIMRKIDACTKADVVRIFNALKHGVTFVLEEEDDEETL